MSKERRADQVNRGGWPLTVELLRDSGYNPDEILATTIDEFGYDTFVRNGNGVKLYNGDKPVVTHHEWLSEDFGIRVMEMIWKEEGLS